MTFDQKFDGNGNSKQVKPTDQASVAVIYALGIICKTFDSFNAASKTFKYVVRMGKEINTAIGSIHRYAKLIYKYSLF